MMRREARRCSRRAQEVPTLNVEEVRLLVAYDRWATARLLEVIDRLDDGQRSAQIQSSFPSILETVAHIAAAEWVWLRRWQGESPTAFPDWVEDVGWEDLKRRLGEVEGERDAWLADRGEADLEGEVAYRTFAGEPCRNRLIDLLRHVVNHSSYHRGQLVTMLRQLGVEPVATDLIVFLRERAGRADGGSR